MPRWRLRHQGAPARWATIASMTFPLGSLGADGAASGAHQRATAASPAPRWWSQALLLGGGVVWLLMLLALVTHQPSDPAFSTSGSGAAVANKAGLFGAWASDLALFLFGYSVWILMAVGLRTWLTTLALWLRGAASAADATDEPLALPSGWFWVGLGLLLTASCSLEWTRLYRLDGLLPGGQSGGVLGAVAGGLSMKWLGFAGSGVLWIAAWVLGLALAFRFSWARVADKLGFWIEGLWRRQADARDVKEDLRIAELLTREREQVVEVERHEVQDHAPIIIDRPMVEVPKSTRVAKERQQPLFKDLHDTKLPQVDLLDAAPTLRVDSVTPESVEMTSRLIEKKLRDFGVEVRVVAASPGPVITRYEIEPATGVKGAQVVNLAKDLARSLSLVSIRVVEIIPGKTTMALELPNAKRQMIRLAEILGSQIYLRQLGVVQLLEQRLLPLLGHARALGHLDHRLFDQDRQMVLDFSAAHFNHLLTLAGQHHGNAPVLFDLARHRLALPQALDALAQGVGHPRPGEAQRQRQPQHPGSDPQHSRAGKTQPLHRQATGHCAQHTAGLATRQGSVQAVEPGPLQTAT